MGLGQLLRGTVFSYGNSMGCRTAEILAIRDDGEYRIERALWVSIMAVEIEQQNMMRMMDTR